MSTPMIILNIKSKYSEFNPAMKQVADFLIGSYDSVVYMNLRDIASKSNVSDASITRFIQAIGFRNFKSFQVELAKSLSSAASGSGSRQSNHRPIFEYAVSANSNSTLDICREVFMSNIRMLSDTLSILDMDSIEVIAGKITKAKSVIFYGVGRSYITAESGRTRLYRLGIHSFCYSDAAEQIVSSSSVSEQDVVICISNYGRTRSVVESAARARALGAVTIGITSSKDSPLTGEVDYPLYTAYNYAGSEEKSNIKAYEPSCENIAQIALIDAIYMCTATKMDKNIIEQFNVSSSRLESEKI